jgi:hypothetical protein
MNNYDVFNGDADGICALVQLRNADPRDAELVTGVNDLPTDMPDQFVDTFQAYYR